MVLFLSCSCLSSFSHVPTFVIKPKNQQTLFKVTSFHQTTLHSTSLYLPYPLSRKNFHKCFSEQKQSQSIQEEEQEKEQQQEFKFERLFSNLNQATLKREPGSLSSAIFLVAGTTVGAGILAIPAVTQESGFLASTVTCILCWIGLFSGKGSAATSGATSPVDWSTGGSMQFDYTSIDWSLDRGLASPRSNALWLGLSPFTKSRAQMYDPTASGGVAQQQTMRSLPSNGIVVPTPVLQDGGAASAETSDAGSHEWSSPFEGKDLFTLPRQFVSSPSR